MICLEDLKVKNLFRRSEGEEYDDRVQRVHEKGTREDPGKNVKAKSGLSRAIVRQGWSQFEEFLRYKSDWYGSAVILGDPKYTSQRCSVCGHVRERE